jgi:YVTN family beta-propeller protein
VRVPAGPEVAVDEASDTVYVAIATVAHGPHGGTVAVIDGATCDGARHAGCGQTVGSIAVAAPSNWIELDAPAHTVYTVYTADNENSVNNVSVIDTATCNATRRSGCGQKTSTVPLNSSDPFAISIDQALHTVYVANLLDDTVSVIDASTCDAAHRSSCGRIPPTVQVGAGPAFLVTDPGTGTVYSANSVDNTVSVINAGAYDATNTVGCRYLAPTARVGTDPGGVAVDQTHHSVYITDSGANAVSVINTATCNATRRQRCRPAATIHVGTDPVGIAVDQATGTVYVTDNGANTVSVINAATCNATHHTGCKQKAPTVKVGDQPLGIAVNTRTDTVYMANTGQFNGDVVGDTVSVINGTACNGTRHTGCARAPATVRVGLSPFGVAVDQVTNTVYVANSCDTAQPATLSVINGATCDVVNTTGCARSPRVLPGIGRAPNLIVYDSSTHTVDTTHYGDASVSEVNVGRRTPQVHPPRLAVGIEPVDIAIDAADNTLDVANNDRSGTVSILPEQPVRTP